MSIEAMIEVIERVGSDPEFRQQLRTNPDAVLVNYELNTAELAALKSGNRRALVALGLPVSLVWYLVASRGWRGLGFLAIFVGWDWVLGIVAAVLSHVLSGRS